MLKCMAYRDDGTICGSTATRVDGQRGAYVCDAHALAPVDAGEAAAMGWDPAQEVRPPDVIDGQRGMTDATAGDRRRRRGG